jgi:superfamily I DNA and RNA helicase
MQYQMVQRQNHDHNALFDRKVDLITSGLQPYLNRFLKDENQISKENALTIYDYIMALKTEINLSDNYRRTTMYIQLFP